MTDSHAMNPGELEALDLSRVFHPNTNLAAYHKSGPLMLERGEGIYIWDNHGNQYIEGMAGLWCTTLGYGDVVLEDVWRLLSSFEAANGRQDRGGESCAPDTLGPW